MKQKEKQRTGRDHWSIRRADRAVSQSEALELLDKADFGVLSTVGADGCPYGVPLNFVRIGEKLIVHCAQQGRKVENVRQNDQVSFCIVGQNQVRPETLTTFYESVIVSGTAIWIEDPEPKRAALFALCQKFDPEKSYPANLEQMIDKQLHQTGLIEITIEQMTGKANRPTEREDDIQPE
ncbi:MAG: pyridoxamine 5'-phosphate oxidase family protein [Thermoguttaceae bacterium]